MKGFIQVNKSTRPFWVNISQIAYLYDKRIVLANGKIEIVEESASDMLADIKASYEASWQIGRPTKFGKYRVIWVDTDDDVVRCSDLFWNEGNDTWYDEETPDCNWGDEYHAVVVVWKEIDPHKA